MSAVSAVVNWGTSPKAFVFRNYNHTPGSLSRYAGGSGYRMWQAVRASSAAPGYFQEFTLQGDIHQVRQKDVYGNNGTTVLCYQCPLRSSNKLAMVLNIIILYMIILYIHNSRVTFYYKRCFNFTKLSPKLSPILSQNAKPSHNFIPYPNIIVHPNTYPLNYLFQCILTVK